MKALVLNQDSQTQRMAFQTEQLRGLGIDFQRVPAAAINGTDDPIYKKLYNKWQRPMTVAEVSCFLSHINIWEIVISNNEPMLVLEDDAWLDENISDVLEELKHSTDIDYVTLEGARLNKKKLLSKKPVNTFSDVDLYRLYKGRSGSAGYVIWPSGAVKLLEVASKGKAAIADRFINSHFALNAYQIEPAPIIQLDQCAFHDIEPPIEVKSTITTKTKAELKFADKVRYKTRRIIGECNIGLNFLRHTHHANRRHVEISPYFKRANQK